MSLLLYAMTRVSVLVNADNRRDPCARKPVKLTESSGTIKSPGYDQSTYDNDAYCRWLIKAPAGKVRCMNEFVIVTNLTNTSTVRFDMFTLIGFECFQRYQYYTYG